MKNVALLIAFSICLVAAILQYLRYYFQIEIVLGGKHSIPLELSLYGSIGFLAVASLMLISALIKK